MGEVGAHKVDGPMVQPNRKGMIAFRANNSSGLVPATARCNGAENGETEAHSPMRLGAKNC